jgi:hypothetical protein
MVKKQTHGILVRSLDCLVGDLGLILRDPTKILNNPIHKWPMGGCHVVASHWSIIAMCQHTISPPVSYRLPCHLVSQTYGVPCGTSWCCHVRIVWMYSHATCHPSSGDTCHPLTLTFSFFAWFDLNFDRS